ncbi:MAG: hypothetical protein SFZ03_05660 [Candidatus Melainabacteria bacterium]|nr:hypothetical protein [Candidatus Melainabacteria bacterium]
MFVQPRFQSLFVMTPLLNKEACQMTVDGLGHAHVNGSSLDGRPVTVRLPAQPRAVLVGHLFRTAEPRQEEHLMSQLLKRHEEVVGNRVLVDQLMAPVPYSTERTKTLPAVLEVFRKLATVVLESVKEEFSMSPAKFQQQLRENSPSPGVELSEMAQMLAQLSNTPAATVAQVTEKYPAFMGRLQQFYTKHTGQALPEALEDVQNTLNEMSEAKGAVCGIQFNWRDA